MTASSGCSCPGRSVDLQLLVSERPSQMRWCGPWEPEPLGRWWSVSTERGNLAVSSARRLEAGRSISSVDLRVHRGQQVAVKIAKNTGCFSEVARSEIAVLEEINSLDDDNRL